MSGVLIQRREDGVDIVIGRETMRLGSSCQIQDVVVGVQAVRIIKAKDFVIAMIPGAFPQVRLEEFVRFFGQRVFVVSDGDDVEFVEDADILVGEVPDQHIGFSVHVRHPFVDRPRPDFCGLGFFLDQNEDIAFRD